MKFKELSCEELKKKFEVILNSFSNKDLIETLKPYIKDKESNNDFTD